MSVVKSKALIVGDGAIGKTCLLSRITNNAIDWADGDVEYEPTTFNNFNLTWDDEDESGDTRTLELELWDTAGQEGFEQLRTLSYPGTDVYLVGYACNTAISLNNVEHKWIAEIKKCREENGELDEPWIILVGTKMDIRDGVTLEGAKEVANTINACTMVDTSAKIDDKEASGVEKLESLMMTLGFMKAAGEPKPNWGDFPGDVEEAPAATKTPKTTKKKPNTAPVNPNPPPSTGGGGGKTGGKTTSSGGSSGGGATSTDTQDKGCACVIA
jgi:small GTP-binding protein